MCLNFREEVEIDEVRGYKIFSEKNGRLQSAFLPSLRSDLFYKTNEKITVHPPEGVFFGFQKFEDAVRMACERRCNFAHKNRFVLPVTLKKVVAQGELRLPSNDIQCMDTYFPAYEAKEIIVWDNPDLRKEFYQAVLSRYFQGEKHTLSHIERQAIKSLLPDFASALD